MNPDAEATIRIAHRPTTRAVPHVCFPDGRISTAWEDFHAVRRLQRPELYAGAQEQAT